MQALRRSEEGICQVMRHHAVVGYANREHATRLPRFCG